MIGASIYAGLVVLGILVWPASLAPYGLAMYFAFGLNSLVFVLVVTYTYNSHMSFWKGLVHMSGSMMCGCANITILYLIPTLAIVYLLAVFYSLIGLFKGKEYTEQRWIATVNWVGPSGQWRI